ncbi:MAG TPA: metallophosphoesterase family protein [Anaerolineales bacterium]|nr:metallophosphoesterase family protein [Anaerolineales bacterium]HNN13086.1 metallophosphoesterase family protein [Anaerolineales bacterium]HNO30761.1 metallophosphoesterase family protein [Anaerolineales bacterium]
MRIAFISDIHGNFLALESVLADIKKQGADQIICLGDTVTLGPQPREVLDMLRDLKCVNIKGNHDAAILEPAKAAEYEITEYLVPDLHWGRERLSNEDFKFIDSFIPTHEIEFPNGIHLLAFHGSPFSTTDLILATTSSEKLDEYFAGQPATVFIGGHSHIQMQRRYGKLLILNSGSVGNAFVRAFTPGNPPSLLPWAEYAILEQKKDIFSVDLRRVYFDTDALLEIVKKSGLPGTDWWLRQYKDK